MMGIINAEAIVEEQLAAAKTVHFCQNPIINSVLTVKMNIVKANGIETDILLNDCENLPFDNYDICSLFANLYDNAVEACQKIEENKERRITMRSSIKNDYFVLKIVNTCIEMPEIKSGKIKSLLKRNLRFFALKFPLLNEKNAPEISGAF